MITVAQVLGLHGLDLKPVVTGDVALSVSWVATSELQDPTPYLNGGEIILFTGLTRRPAHPTWESYVRRLVEQGVVALGMGVGGGLTWDHVPKELVEAAHRVGLTLFEVPEQTPFLRIIQDVARLRAAEERRALETTLANQRALTRAAAAVEGSAQVLRTLAELLPGAWAAVCSADAEIRERSAPGIPPLPSERSLEELVGRLQGAGLLGSLSESGPRGVVVIHPLGVYGEPHGYLIVVLPRVVESSQAATIATAVTLLSLHGERAAEQRLSQRRVRAGAVALLLRGDIRAGDALLAVAGDEGWGKVVRKVRAVRLRGSATDTQEAIRRIEAHAQRTGHRVLTGTSATIDSNFGATKNEEEMPVLIEDSDLSQKALRQAVETVWIRVGIGGSAALEASATSHSEALHALERTGGRQRVVAWDDIVTGGASGLLPPEPARAWARTFLEPLVAQGPAGSRLIMTLRVFLDHNGNRRRTAEALGVHRNTLLNHLSLVERAFRRSLDDPQLRADLWIALHLPGDHQNRPTQA